MKNNNTLKAILIFAIFIILFSISLFFINNNEKPNNLVLANKEELNEKIFIPRKAKTSNNTTLNNIGGSNDEILLNTFFIDNKIYVLFKSTSNDYDLITNNNKTLNLALLDDNLSLLAIYEINNIEEYITSFLFNNNIYIFQNENCGIETIFDTYENKILKVNEFPNLFNNAFIVNNNIVYIFNQNDEKILNILGNLFHLDKNTKYQTFISTPNKTFLVFYDNKNSYIFDVQKNSFIFTFESCKIANIKQENDYIFIIFDINKHIVFSKFTNDFKEIFSTEINTLGTNFIELSIKNNGYLIYTKEINNIITTFICLHGDIISRTSKTIENVKEIICAEFFKNNLILIGITQNNNFFISIQNENLDEKKYMTLNTNVIYNFNYNFANDKIYLFVSSEFNSFEFIDNFGKQDIFAFLK